MSGDGKFAFLVVNDRAQSRTAQVPRFVSETAFTEEINARARSSATRRIAGASRCSISNPAKRVWAGLDGVSDPIAIPKPPLRR